MTDERFYDDFDVDDRPDDYHENFHDRPVENNNNSRTVKVIILGLMVALIWKWWSNWFGEGRRRREYYNRYY